MTKIIPITPTSLGTFQTCPRQFEAKYITKEVVFKPTAATEEGNHMHKALEQRLLPSQTRLPPEYAHLETLAAAVMSAPGQRFIEYKLAIDANDRPCGWWDRAEGAIADVLVVNGKRALVLDWKSGKVKDDPLQLNLLTKCVFATFPEVQTVTGQLAFVAHDDAMTITTERCRADFRELRTLAADYRFAQTSSHYPPKRSGLCRQWCDVTRCEHHGR